MCERDIYGLCRVCLNDSQCYSHIYEEFLRDFYLYEVLNDVCQLHVKLDDGLPEFVCCECHKRISDFESFKRQSHEGSATLRRIKCDLENVTIKVEEGSFENETVEEEYTRFSAQVSVKAEEDAFENESMEEQLVYPTQVRVKAEKINFEDECKQEDYTLELTGEAEVSMGNSLRVGYAGYPTEDSSFAVCDTEVAARNQECNRAEINIGKGRKGGKCFGKRKSHLDFEGFVTNTIQRAAPIEDTRVSMACANEGCVNLEEENNDYGLESYDSTKGRFKSKAKSFKGFKTQSPGRHLSICEDVGMSYGNDDCRKHPSCFMDIGATVKKSISETDNKEASKSSSLNEESCKLGTKLKKVNPYSGKKSSKLTGFFCDVCKKRFQSKHDVGCHVRVHTGVRPYQCSMCEKTFTQETSLHRHAVFHCRPHVYDQSGKPYEVNSSLTEHSKTHPKRYEYRCDVCNKTYSRKDRLSMHIRQHNGFKPYRCNICGANFFDAYHRKRHLIKHSDKLPYVCDICGQGFAEQYRLKRHQVRHTDVRPFSCNDCSKSFKTKAALEQHVYTHNGLKPFKCSICAKNFPRKWTLQNHMKSHSTLRPFPCPDCGKSFKYMNNIREHLKLFCKGKLVV